MFDLSCNANPHLKLNILQYLISRDSEISTSSTADFTSSVLARRLVIASQIALVICEQNVYVASYIIVSVITD